jgi:methylase of polypeptide subunit release factors
VLSSSGYIHYYLAFGNGNMRQDEWIDNADNLSVPLKQLVELFLLNKPIETPVVLELLGEGVHQELLKAEILADESGLTSTNGYILVCFNSILFFCEPNLHLKPPSVYFGPDSVALGTYHIPSFNGKGLDLCAGSAIQAMNVAPRCQEVYAVEINERATKLAQFNICLNFLDEKVRLFNLSIEDFAAQNESQFDLIVFNPPFVPIPKSLKFPFVGGGGEDGLGLTKKILTLYLPRLNEGGAIEFLGCGLGANNVAGFVEDLNKFLSGGNFFGHALLTSKTKLKQGNWFYDTVVLRGALNSNTPVDIAYKVFGEHFEQLGVNEIYSFFMRVEKDNRRQRVDNPIIVTNLAKNLPMGSIILSQSWQLV